MSALPTRTLGQTDLALSPVGIGTAPIGSHPSWRIDWGPQDEGDAIRAIHAALDQGVNWIDTAPFYGWGRAEEIVGRALAGRRNDALVFTKCGTLPDGDGGWRDDLSPASVRREVDASLRRLRIDCLDLLQFHSPDASTPIEESWGTVQELIAEGKVRYAGLSNFPIDLMRRAQAVAPVASSQDQYSLLHREIEGDHLPYCQHAGIGVLAWAPLASGFLVDGFDVHRLSPTDFRRAHTYAQPPMADRLARLREDLTAVARDHGHTLLDLAIAWVLRHEAVTGAIVGVRSAREARAMTPGARWRLDAATVAAIEEVLERMAERRQ